MWLGGVRMPERATGGDAVANALFDLLDFRKAAPLLPRPDDLVINAHLKDATGPIRGERHGAELVGKRGQELLPPLLLGGGFPSGTGEGSNR